ncbi:MAG TPA: YoaK family protein [Vineibacter sp.]|nr:YoaK family protein [Vineibacter sp.]
MRQPPSGTLALAVALTAIAGFVDAIGFLSLRHYFVSFMSGNTTQFAVAAGRGDAHAALAAIGIVGTFVAAVAAGRFASCRAPNGYRPMILLAEAALIGTAAMADIALAGATGLLVIAMGLQTALVHRAGETRTSLTYVTGTLVSVGEKLSDAVSGRGAPWAWWRDLCLWTALVLGAVAGTMAYAPVGKAALMLASCVLALLAAVMAVPSWRAHRRQR